MYYIIYIYLAIVTCMLNGMEIKYLTKKKKKKKKDTRRWWWEYEFRAVMNSPQRQRDFSKTFRLVLCKSLLVWKKKKIKNLKQKKKKKKKKKKTLDCSSLHLENVDLL